MPDPYDLVPYECHAVAETYIDRLAVVALAHGLRPAPVTRCRVLELGCGDATNLLAMAFHLATSEFVGVERSAVQHNAGVAARDRLGVSNLHLRCADVRRLGAELGTFDYILVHGVLSWVAPRVRERILALCARHLAPHGVAYVSYNTLPGWGVRGQVRDAMLSQVGEAVDPRERVARARATLALLAATSEGVRGEYVALLAREIKRAQSSSDAYLLHEFLAPYNRAFRFRDFVAMAARHGLAYLDEMLTAVRDVNTETVLRRKLRDAVADPIATEQLADYVFNRQFRATLLCRREATPSPGRNLDALVGRCLLAGELGPESPQPSLDPDVTEGFRMEGRSRVTTGHPLLKAALLELKRAWPEALTFGDLYGRAAALLSVRGNFPHEAVVSEDVRRRLAGDLTYLVSTGHLEFRTWQPPFAPRASAAAGVSALTRFEAERRQIVTNMLHRPVDLGPFVRVLVRYLDGTRDRAGLLDRLAAAFAQGELSLRRTDGPTPGPDEVRAMLPKLVDEAVTLLEHQALLVARG
jgi:methyltransferase-like protein